MYVHLIKVVQTFTFGSKWKLRMGRLFYFFLYGLALLLTHFSLYLLCSVNECGETVVANMKEHMLSVVLVVCHAEAVHPKREKKEDGLSK